MKTLTVRLPEALAADIESESRIAGIPKSDVVRRRLEAAAGRSTGKRARASFFELAGDLIGSVDDKSIPRTLSSRRKLYLKKWRYGQGDHR